MSIRSSKCRFVQLIIIASHDMLLSILHPGLGRYSFYSCRMWETGLHEGKEAIILGQLVPVSTVRKASQTNSETGSSPMVCRPLNVIREEGTIVELSTM